MKNEIAQKELVDHLRHELNLSTDLATDSEILTMTKGTFVRERVELGMAWRTLIEEIRKIFGFDI